jgi:hypothetical protein
MSNVSITGLLLIAALLYLAAVQWMGSYLYKRFRSMELAIFVPCMLTGIAVFVSGYFL